MLPAPMHPLQNVLVICASFLVSGALLPWSARVRIACAGGAIAIMLLLLVWRVRGHAVSGPMRDADATQRRIDRIRTARANRMRRR